MTRYWYLVASLPALVKGAPPPLDARRFRTLCSEHLVPADLAELDAVLAGAGTSAFARAWRDADVQIRNAIARARAARHGVDAERFVRSTDALDLALARRVQDALGAADPGECERALDELRREILHELARPEPFAVSVLLAYGLELAIAARQHARDAERGRVALASLVDGLVASSETASSSVTVPQP